MHHTRGAAEAGRSGTSEGLLEQGPPFNPAERGLARHAVYLSAGEVVFVFEGDEVASIVNEIVSEPFGAVAEALGRWRELVEDPGHASPGVSTPGKATRTSQRAVWPQRSATICEMA